MFERFRERVQRAMSFEHLRHPVSHERSQENATSPDTPKSPPRKLRRTAAVSDLKIPFGTNRPHQPLRLSPLTPQYRRPISRKELQRSNSLVRGVLEKDGTLVRLPSGEVLSVKESFTSISKDDDSPFVRPEEPLRPRSIPRRASNATFIIHGEGRDELASEEDISLLVSGQFERSTSRKRGHTSSDDAGYSDTEGAFRFHKRVCKSPESHWAKHFSLPSLSQKRARSIHDSPSGIDPEPPMRPQKRVCRSPDCPQSDRSSSPSPPQKRHRPFTRISAQHTRSISHIGFTRGESMENHSVHHYRSKSARRVWSADDVLNALRAGRTSTQTLEHGQTTPPHSPIISPYPVQGHIYSLPLPKPQPPKLIRQPLANITYKFVPEFLQPLSPVLHAQDGPPTPGYTVQLLESGTEYRASPGQSTCGLAGTIDSRARPDEVHDTSEKEAVPINPGLGEDLRNAGEDGNLKLPIVAHVLRGLNNDAKFLQDALRQINLLREKVIKHDLWAKKAKVLLERRQEAVTKDEKSQAMGNMAQYVREAKACEEAADRADAEAGEYRRKAKELLENALAEVAMFEVAHHDSEDENEKVLLE